MSAQLNLNMHQAYGFAYDQTAVGWCVPQSPGGSGGGVESTLNAGRRASFDPKRFNKCLQDFFRIVPAKGSPIFLRKNGGLFSGFTNGDPDHTYAVTTSINRNSAALAQDLNRANNTPHKWAAQSGLTLADDFMGRSGLNYVASDVVADSNFVDIGVFGLYVHELGNALGVETGMDTPFGAYAEANAAKYGVTDDPDVGVAFEGCVFGGIVGLRTGRVGSHREF
jgi:hypothetical protein